MYRLIHVYTLSGVMIVTPTRNYPGHFRSPHANILGRVILNGLPVGKKAEMRLLVDLTNEAQHVGTREVSLECAERKSAVYCHDPVWSFHHNYIIFTQNTVFMHNS